MARPPLHRIEELFNKAADLAPGERAVFLERECAGDNVLRAAVEELLRNDEDISKTEVFLASPIDRTQVDNRPAAERGQFGEALALLRHALEGYELLEVLGSGGMGVVFKARQIGLDRLVAVKMLLSAASVNADQLARFRTEAEALARLQHPHIVQIHEVGEHEGRPYIVMEYVPGPNLARVIGGRPQPAEEAARLVEVLAEALQAVHACGIIHRDLKPANILLKHPDKTPKITDFGLAKRLDGGSGQTRSGAILGTPSYMAPEQARGRGELGPATDVYALGVILYELLTGRPPFEGASPAETIAQVLEEEPISPARLRPTLPRDLVTICLKCLEKDPRRRYASAAALADDLHRFLAGMPIRARPVGAPERLWRWCRRRPQVAALTAATSVLAVALVVTVIVYEALLQEATAQKLEESEHKLQDTGAIAEEKNRLAEQERRQLVTLTITLSERALAEGDTFTALLWTTEALRLDIDFPEQQRRHRQRIGRLLRECPRLLRQVSYDQPLVAAHVGPYGCWLATAGENRTLQVWDGRTSQPRVLRGACPSGTESLVAISPDGRLVAVAGAAGTTRLWDLSSGLPQPIVLRHEKPLLRIAFSADSQLLLAHLTDKTVRVWNLRTGQRVPLGEGKESASNCAALCDNGRQLVTLSTDGVAQVWLMPDGKRAADPVKLGHAAAVAALSPDGSQVAVVDEQNALWLWNVATGKERLLVGSLRSVGLVTALQWSPDARHLLTVGNLDRARAWDVGTGTPATPPLPHASRWPAAGFAGNNTVVTLDQHGGACFWALSEKQGEGRGAELAEHPLKELLEVAQLLSGRRLGPDGTLLPLDAVHARTAWQHWKTEWEAAKERREGEAHTP
jgi:serine/threonine protein kinase